MPLLEILKATRETVLKMDIEAIVRIAGRKLSDGDSYSLKLRDGSVDLEKYRI